MKVSEALADEITIATKSTEAAIGSTHATSTITPMVLSPATRHRLPSVQVMTGQCGWIALSSIAVPKLQVVVYSWLAKPTAS